jgi:hypothetical protein
VQGKRTVAPNALPDGEAALQKASSASARQVIALVASLDRVPVPASDRANFRHLKSALTNEADAYGNMARAAATRIPGNRRGASSRLERAAAHVDATAGELGRLRC